MCRGLCDGRRDQQYLAARLGRVSRKLNPIGLIGPVGPIRGCTMNRRTFTKALGFGVAAVGFGGVPAIARVSRPQFSITMDDFFWSNAVGLTAEERNNAILDT